MPIQIRTFDELSLKELYGILKARQEVFVVEQKIAYLDLDGKDFYSFHFSYYDQDPHALLTEPALPSGTDRVKAAADLYDPQGRYKYIINIQGDLPTLDPSLVSHVLQPLQNPDVDIATLATPIEDEHELNDSNVVKIALSLKEGDLIGRALYFSRNIIPSGPGTYYHHIGLYAYKRERLNQFVSLPIDPLETREKLEQLRALAHGMRIDVKVVHTGAPFGVDTPADLEKAIKMVQERNSYST